MAHIVVSDPISVAVDYDSPLAELVERSRLNMAAWEIDKLDRHFPSIRRGKSTILMVLGYFEGWVEMWQISNIGSFGEFRHPELVELVSLAVSYPDDKFDGYRILALDPHGWSKGELGVFPHLVYGDSGRRVEPAAPTPVSAVFPPELRFALVSIIG